MRNFSDTLRVAYGSLPSDSGHEVRGIGAYTRSLFEQLNKRPDIEVQEFSDISKVLFADVAHYPFFDLFERTLPFKHPFPTLVTVYDVTPLIFPEHYPPGIRGSINNHWQKLAIKGVHGVITISQSAKEDIVKYLNIDPEKVYPIHLSASNKFKPIKDTTEIEQVKQKYKLPKQYAVYVGNVNWNKNLLNLTQASLDAGVDLVLIGKSFEVKDNLDHPELESYKEFLRLYGQSKNIHILGYIQEEELVILMNGAKLMLFPSFAEGFGLPILEAQSCGIPVITSNISSMPEVAGDSALLVDPYSVESISKAIKEILNNKKISDNLIEKGFENIKQFSWEKTAAETVKVYEKIAEDK